MGASASLQVKTPLGRGQQPLHREEDANARDLLLALNVQRCGDHSLCSAVRRRRQPSASRRRRVTGRANQDKYKLEDQLSDM